MEFEGRIQKQFDKAVNYILIDIPSIGDELTEFAQRVSSGNCDVIADTISELPSSMTFSLSTGSTTPIPKPIILLNPNQILNFSTKDFALDLIRTLGVLKQYPANGYQRSSRETMLEALEFQRQAMLENNLHYDRATALDPMTKDHEGIVYGMIGKQRYLADFGIAEYAKVVSKHGHQKLAGTLAMKVGLNFGLFLKYRSSLNQFTYSSIVEELSEESMLPLIPHNTRRELAANSFFLMLLQKTANTSY